MDLVNKKLLNKYVWPNLTMGIFLTSVALSSDSMLLFLSTVCMGISWLILLVSQISKESWSLLNFYFSEKRHKKKRLESHNILPDSPLWDDSQPRVEYLEINNRAGFLKIPPILFKKVGSVKKVDRFNVYLSPGGRVPSYMILGQVDHRISIDLRYERVLEEHREKLKYKQEELRRLNNEN